MRRADSPGRTCSDHELERRIGHRLAELATLAAPLCRRHGVLVPQPEVRFDLRGQAAGQARWHKVDGVQLRFNLALARTRPGHFVEHTVAHEFAHLVTYACHGRTPPHGAEWRNVMRHLGIRNPQRCHDYPVDETGVRRQQRWPYACACGTHALSTTRHRRVQAGSASYLCRRCGQALRQAPANGD